MEKAWKEIFIMLDNKSSNLDEQIAKKSDELWINNQYLKNEEDRVVLYVKLEAKKNNSKIFEGSYFLDEKGSNENTAMGKLVSLTLSASIDLILENKFRILVFKQPLR